MSSKKSLVNAARILALPVALCFSGSAFAAPVSASMNVGADATTSGGATASQSSTAAWGTLLSPLSVSATATATDVSGTSASAFGTGSASWGAGGNSGVVNFSNYGWQFNGTGGVADVNRLTDWTYVFTADSNGQFNMGYDVGSSGDGFGLWGWNILWNGTGLLTLNAFSPNAIGSVSESVVAGDTYTVNLSNNANIETQGPLAGSMSGYFEWNISNSVPEPSTVALVGIALAGLSLLRGRKA